MSFVRLPQHQYRFPYAGFSLNRRQFFQLTSLFSLSLGMTLAGSGCSKKATEPSIIELKETQNNRDTVRIGYLPITDAAALLAAYDKGFYQREGLEVEAPQAYRSWDAIVEGFMSRQVNVIHVLMPTTFWIRYGHHFPGKVVAWNHTNGSALTVLPEINQPEDLGGREIAVPSWYSIHNIVVQMLLKQHGLKVVTKPRVQPLQPDQVGLLVLAPPDMLQALSDGKIAGYIVAEPYNSAAENLQKGKILRLTGDIWKDHACCVVLMHEDDVTQRRDWTQKVVNAIVKSQQWAKVNRPELAFILSQDGGQYIPYSLPVLERVLTYYDNDFYRRQGAIIHPQWRSQRIDFQPYPFPSYTAQLMEVIKETLMEDDNNFLRELTSEFVAQDLVDDSFVKQALQEVGGPQAFGLSLDLNRTEEIKA